MRHRPAVSPPRAAGADGPPSEPAGRAESYSTRRSDGQLVGEFADAVRDRLYDALGERRPDLDWTTEHRVRTTPVDVVGVGGTAADDAPAHGSEPDPPRFVAVEVEWRRADPANNTAKLFYYAAEGEFDGYDEVVVCQVFSGYYDLDSGGVSSKREVAEFVGRTAAATVERVSYRPVALPVDPPNRGGEWPTGWRAAVDDAAAELAEWV